MNSIKYLLMAGGFLMSSENTASIQDEYQYDSQGRPIIPPQEELINISKDGGELWNRLVFESSPYLLQHAANPVDWYPWVRKHSLKRKR